MPEVPDDAKKVYAPLVGPPSKNGVISFVPRRLIGDVLYGGHYVVLFRDGRMFFVRDILTAWLQANPKDAKQCGYKDGSGVQCPRVAEVGKAYEWCREHLEATFGSQPHERCGKQGCLEAAEEWIQGGLRYAACHRHVDEIRQLTERE